MEGCTVSVSKLIPCDRPDFCAFLDNENINHGILRKGLRDALEKEKTSYLVDLVANHLGSAFKCCAAHDFIVNLASEILRTRSQRNSGK